MAACWRFLVVEPAHPSNGRREWPLGLFEIGWRLARFQVIVIVPES